MSLCPEQSTRSRRSMRSLHRGIVVTSRSHCQVVQSLQGHSIGLAPYATSVSTWVHRGTLPLLRARRFGAGGANATDAVCTERLVEDSSDAPAHRRRPVWMMMTARTLMAEAQR